jgi:hypothetical protein
MEAKSVTGVGSKSVLGTSLSSDFFKKVRENPEAMVSFPSLSSLPSPGVSFSQSLPPPPEYSPKVESSMTSINSKEALYHKQQETAAAVSQMRNRLKAMGILEKTVALAQEQEQGASNPPPEFLPPPPPLPSPVAPASGSLQPKQGSLAAGAGAAVVAVMDSEDDDTVSTVSGGSDLQEEEEDEEEPLDESFYRELLR